MILPNAEAAIIEIAKLRDYCLNPLHPRGKHKARILRAALGITHLDSEEFRRLLLAGIQNTECQIGERDDYGSRYTVDLEITRDEHSAIVRTGWIIKTGETAPRLTTCFVKRD